MGYAKYVVFTDAEHPQIPGREHHAVIFPEIINHVDMANAYMHRCDGRVMPIGAGFVAFGTDGQHQVTVDAHGGSTSMGLKSRGELDASVIRRKLIDPYGGN